MYPANVISIIAVSDRPLFEHILKQNGLYIAGLQNIDPLESHIQPSLITSIASALVENINDHVELTPYQNNLKNIAEKAGYVVAIDEGLDQLPGTDCNPIATELRHPKEDEEEPPPEEEPQQ